MRTFVDAYYDLCKVQKEKASFPALRLFLDYLRIKLKFKLWLRPLGLAPAGDRVLNYFVYSPSYRHLLFMVKEVMVGAGYFFRATRPDPYILDCGSNIGLSVLFFKTLYPQATIQAFEPSPTTFATLKKNVESNKLANVTPNNVALTDKEGELTFYIDTQKPWSGHNSVQEERMFKVAEKTPIQVKATKLSNFIDREVDFLKLDVEGAEHGVIKDLVESGKLGFIRQMIMEYHHHANPKEERLGEMLAILEKHGFGYQLIAGASLPFRAEELQDVIIYAYKK